MIVVDASVLFEVIVGGSRTTGVARRFADDPDLAAPHVIDVEVFGVIRDHVLRSLLDPSAARIAVAQVRDWPGERFAHSALLARAWALRETVRGWDAMYVALAELLDAPLLTLDRRLAAAAGPRCVIDCLD